MGGKTGVTESSISLASDYLRGWCEFPGPITDDNEAKVSILACLTATQTGCVFYLTGKPVKRSSSMSISLWLRG